MAQGVFLALAIWCILSLMVTRLRQPFHYWIYPFTIVFLLPLWLIEQRYTFIPFALWILFRREEDRGFEWKLASYGIVGTIVVFIAVARRMFYL